MGKEFPHEKINASKVFIIAGLVFGLIVTWTCSTASELSTRETSFFMGGQENYGCCRTQTGGSTNCPGSGCSVPWTTCVRNVNYSLTCWVDLCHDTNSACDPGYRYGVCY